MTAEEGRHRVRGRALRDRGAAIARDASALGDLFLTVSVYGAAVVVGLVWLGLGLRLFLMIGGFR